MLKLSIVLILLHLEYMFNAGVPRSGEIARCTLLNKVSKTPITYLFGHVLMRGLIDFVILGLYVFSLICIYKFKGMVMQLMRCFQIYSICFKCRIYISCYIISFIYCIYI